MERASAVFQVTLARGESWSFQMEYTAERTQQQEMALAYAERLRWLVIPAYRKRPVFEWNPRLLPCVPDHATQAWWWRSWPDAQVALVTGARSRVIAIDADPRHGGSLEAFYDKGWPRETPTARSGSCVAGDAGGHAFYRYPADGLGVPGALRYGPGCEVKADGSIIVLAPSRHHKTYRRYEWLPGLSPFDLPLAPVPDTVIAELRATRSTHGRDARVTLPLDYDVTDPAAHVYDFDDTVELVTILFNTALRKIRDGEHRNNVAVWLGMQLGTLRLTRQEIVALGALYEGTVRND